MNEDDIAARIAAGQARGAGRPAPSAGGETDVLIALIERMRKEAATHPAHLREVTVGEFLVDGARVPIQLVDPLQALTRTEAAALRFAGWGRANADIAVLLAISEGTVRTHFNSAIRKLELDGMRALIALAGTLFFPLD